MSKKAYEEEDIRAIAQAIRSVTEKTTPLKVADMSSEIKSRMMPIPNYGVASHVDENNKWHKPDAWDDIESMEIAEGASEVYLLYACHLNGTSFMSLRVYGTGTLTWSYGHVSNGVYTPSVADKTFSSGGILRLWLEDLEDDYIVVKIKGTTSITQCYTYAYSTPSYSATLNTCLMRYGRMPKGTNATFSCYYLESDNIMDLAKGLSGTGITIANAYYYNYNMCRWRHSGWKVVGNYTTSLANVFSFCMKLVDVDNLDFSGWCTTKTTTIASMFYYCYMLKDNVDVSGWDVSSVTSFASMFYFCMKIPKIKGLETWGAAPKCTNISTMFYYAVNLAQDINLSALSIGNGTASFTNPSNFVAYSGITSLDISGWNFSKVTSNFTSVFASMHNCRRINLEGCVYPSAATSINQMFYNSKQLEEVEVDGMNFSNIAENSTSGIQYLFYQCFCIKSIKFPNAIAMAKAYKDTSSSYGYIFYQCYQLEYLDASWMDCSLFTSTYVHTYGFRNLYMLKDFYPPKNITKSFYLSTSNLLTHDSLMRVIENLVDLTGGTTQTLSIGAINKAKLTTDELALITDKNWTIA